MDFHIYIDCFGGHCAQAAASVASVMVSVQSFFELQWTDVAQRRVDASPVIPEQAGDGFILGPGG
jgi:hypothetical protein